MTTFLSLCLALRFFLDLTNSFSLEDLIIILERYLVRCLDAGWTQRYLLRSCYTACLVDQADNFDGLLGNGIQLFHTLDYLLQVHVCSHKASRIEKQKSLCAIASTFTYPSR